MSTGGFSSGFSSGFTVGGADTFKKGGFSFGFSSGFAGGFPGSGVIIFPPPPFGDGRQFRLLQDHYVQGPLFTGLLPAGTVCSDLDLLPPNWIPTGEVDPLNTAGINAWIAAGVQLPGLIRNQFVNTPILPPKTKWVYVAGSNPPMWQVNGQGKKYPGPPPGSFV